MSFEIRPLSHALGAEILGLDLSATVDDETVAAIRAAWLDNNVVVIRGQDAMTPDRHIAFSRRLGELDDHRTVPRSRHPDYPEILAITNRPGAGGAPSPTRNTGRQWHTDLSYTTRPALGSLLHCHEIPKAGGDTMFANAYLAWETLSETMRGWLEGLEAVHDVTAIKSYRTRDPKDLEQVRRINPPVAQPVARVHPETGRKALYVTDSATTHFVGMTEEESRPILEFLFRHSVRDEFTYRHRWRVGDLLMWDNRCTLHRALMDYSHETDRRHMLRTTILGEPSGRLEA